MKNYKPYNNYHLGTASSGQSVAVLRGGDVDVAFKSDSAENPGTSHTFIVHLKDVLHAPQVAANLVSLRALDADGLGYVGKGGMIQMYGGKLRFRVKDRLYKLERFPVTNNMRHEVTESGNVRMPDQDGSVSSTADEPPDQANRALAAPASSLPKEVDWNVFHSSVGHMSEELLEASAKSMGVVLTGNLHPCEVCLGTKGTRKPIPKVTETSSNKRLGHAFFDLTGPKERWREGENDMRLCSVMTVPDPCGSLTWRRKVMPRERLNDFCLILVRMVR